MGFDRVFSQFGAEKVADIAHILKDEYYVVHGVVGRTMVVISIG